MRNYRGLGIEELVTSSRLLYRREDYTGKMEIFLLNAEVVVDVEVSFKGGRAWEMIEDTTTTTASSYVTVRSKHDILTGAPDQSNVYTAVFTYFNDDIKYALDNYEKEHPSA